MHTGTDVRVRVDRSLIGRRNIATGQVVGTQDFGSVTRCEAAEGTCPRAAELAAELGIGAAPLQAGGLAAAYGLVARGEAQTYFELPASEDAFDRCSWAHAAGTLLVREAGGAVTDTAGNELDFSVGTGGDARQLPPHVKGVVVTNGDLHPEVLQKLDCAAAATAAA